MKVLALTSKGIEKICKQEIEETLADDLDESPRSVNGAVMFNSSSIQSICQFAYRTQSSDSIILLLDSFDYLDLEDCKSRLDASLSSKDIKHSLNKWLPENSTFKVSSLFFESQIEDEIAFDEFNRFAGGLVIKNLDHEIKVNLKNPDVNFFAYLTDKSLYFGIDLIGFQLNKRDYKIFNASDSIRPTLAYAMARFAAIKKSEVILDAYSSSGENSIESAIFLTCSSHNYFRKEKFAFQKLKLEGMDTELIFKSVDKKKKDISLQLYAYSPNMACLNNSKKNAKIAGLHKAISFSKISIFDLDLKFKEKMVDKIISHLPDAGRIIEGKKATALYEQFFYQSDYILKKEGKIILMVKDKLPIEEAMAKYNFKIEDEMIVYSGEQDYYFLKISK